MKLLDHASQRSSLRQPLKLVSFGLVAVMAVAIAGCGTSSDNRQRNSELTPTDIACADGGACVTGDIGPGDHIFRHDRAGSGFDQPLEGFLVQLADAFEERILTDQQPDQGRWWLGLGVAEDGQGHSLRALDAYRNAQLHGNLGEASTQWLEQRIGQLTH